MCTKELQRERLSHSFGGKFRVIGYRGSHLSPQRSQLSTVLTKARHFILMMSFIAQSKEKVFQSYHKILCVLVLRNNTKQYHNYK